MQRGNQGNKAAFARQALADMMNGQVTSATQALVTEGERADERVARKLGPVRVLKRENDYGTMGPERDIPDHKFDLDGRLQESAQRPQPAYQPPYQPQQPGYYPPQQQRGYYPPQQQPQQYDVPNGYPAPPVPANAIQQMMEGRGRQPQYQPAQYYGEPGPQMLGEEDKRQLANDIVEYVKNSFLREEVMSILMEEVFSTERLNRIMSENFDRLFKAKLDKINQAKAAKAAAAKK